MNFIEISSPEPVVAEITRTLAKHLTAGEKVTWLVPGGSSIIIVARVSQNLVAENLSLENLSVTLTDERYGYVGNPDENWFQLDQAGFSLPGATTYRVLQSGLDRDQTTEKYAEALESLLTNSDFNIGFFGIGADGHTAGIKPHMIDMDTESFATSYRGADYERITMTPRAIGLLNRIYVYAMGNEKASALREFYNEDILPAEQPAQVLKQVADLTLYTDVDILYDKEEQL